MFCPSLTLWDLCLSLAARFLLGTMTSADFSICNSYSSRSPQVRHCSFYWPLLNLLSLACWPRTSQRCACLSALESLRIQFPAETGQALFVRANIRSPASFRLSVTRYTLAAYYRLLSTSSGRSFICWNYLLSSIAAPCWAHTMYKNNCSILGLTKGRCKFTMSDFPAENPRT